MAVLNSRIVSTYYNVRIRILVFSLLFPVVERDITQAVLSLVADLQTVPEQFCFRPPDVDWRDRPTAVHNAARTTATAPGRHGVLLSEDSERNRSAPGKGPHRTFIISRDVAGS